jgi:hypothetical protein
MKGFFCFILGIAVGIGAIWYYKDGRRSTVTTTTTAREIPTDADRTITTTTTNTEVRPRLSDAINTTSIREELNKTGRVIREKARQAGATIADATANARITGTIKAKLLEDSGLSAFKIDVDTTDGVVTLSGKVDSHEQIHRATDLALATDGVHKVISTVQVIEK